MSRGISAPRLVPSSVCPTRTQLEGVRGTSSILDVSGGPPDGPRSARATAPFRRAASLALAILLIVVQAGCSVSARDPASTTAPSTRRDASLGIAYREHHVAGLRVLEVVVGDVPFDAELPLVVQIHGRGDRARLPSGTSFGSTMPVRVLVPEAPAPFQGGFTWSPVSVTEGRTRVLAEALRVNANRIVHVIRYFRSLRAVRGEPIVTGFSQGGMLSFALAVLYPDDVGVALPVAGWLPPPLMPRRVRDPETYPPILALHGSADPIVRLPPTRRCVRKLRALGLSVELTELPGVRHVMTPELGALHRRAMAEAIEREAAAPVTPPSAG